MVAIPRERAPAVEHVQRQVEEGVAGGNGRDWSVPPGPSPRWRRYRRRVREAASELGVILEVLWQERQPARTLRRLVEAAAKSSMKPRDALVFDLDRRADEIAGTFLSKRSLVQIQDTLNPLPHHCLVQDKLNYHAECLVRGVAAPQVLAVVDVSSGADDPAARVNARRICSEGDMAVFLAALPDPTRLIFKKRNGSHGEGLLALTATAAGAIDVQGAKLESGAILRHCQATASDSGYLVQPWLEPDPALRPLMPGPGLGCVRVMTVLIGNEVRIPFAVVRIPVGANVIDDLDYGTRGNLIASVDVAEGTVGKAWGPSRSRRHRLDVYTHHPDTGAAIEGFRVPHWPELRHVVSAGARAFPELLTLGWDVGVTTNGILLLEANHHWDPHGPQITLQRGIGPEMAALAARASSGSTRPA